MSETTVVKAKTDETGDVVDQVNHGKVAIRGNTLPELCMTVKRTDEVILAIVIFMGIAPNPFINNPYLLFDFFVPVGVCTPV